MKPKVKTIASQPSWIISNDSVEVAITQLGGHLAPVTFFPGSAKEIQPYWIAPWANENKRLPAAVLKPLRGDFFCMPFGANSDEIDGKKYPVHGESAVKKWTFRSVDKNDNITKLKLSMNTRIAKGKIDKLTMIVDGHSAVYQTHVLRGFSGAAPLGYHHTIAVPEDKPESLLVSSSPIHFGRTAPVDLAAAAADGEYNALANCEKFTNLSRVPTIYKKPAFTDCSKFPTRYGYGDVLQIYQKPAKTPAWIAASYTADGYLWYALKDPTVLPATVFWMYNHSRWGDPWLGRGACLGLENTCSYFANGLADSIKPNLLTRDGIQTAVKLSPEQPTEVDVIQGVVRTPKGFGKVDKVDFGCNKVTFVSGAKKATAKVNWNFLLTGSL
ncbi:MAG: hypothetical protein KAR11_00050 [Phycisphaerae bacterium]|nr:hypothetical protein [Phycisphaerae bacterium]